MQQKEKRKKKTHRNEMNKKILNFPRENLSSFSRSLFQYSHIKRKKIVLLLLFFVVGTERMAPNFLLLSRPEYLCRRATLRGDSGTLKRCLKGPRLEKWTENLEFFPCFAKILLKKPREGQNFLYTCLESPFQSKIRLKIGLEGSNEASNVPWNPWKDQNPARNKWKWPKWHLKPREGKKILKAG